MHILATINRYIFVITNLAFMYVRVVPRAFLIKDVLQKITYTSQRLVFAHPCVRIVVSQITTLVIYLRLIIQHLLTMFLVCSSFSQRQLLILASHGQCRFPHTFFPRHFCNPSHNFLNETPSCTNLSAYERQTGDFGFSHTFEIGELRATNVGSEQPTRFS